MSEHGMLVVWGGSRTGQGRCVLVGNRGGLAILKALSEAGFRRVEDVAALAQTRPLGLLAGRDEAASGGDLISASC